MKGLRKLKNYWALYLLMVPGLVYLIINNYIPMTGIIIAFKKYNIKDGIYGSPWNGLKNFKYLVSNDLGLILRNTILYNLVFIVLGMFCSVALAIMISDIVNPTAKKIYQSFVMMPFLISMVIVSYIVFAFLSAENGLINKGILIPLGKEPVSWYSTTKPWPFILTFVHLWKSAGYGTLIYIAGIAGIDKELYEAARIDGASRWKQIKAITLPHLIPSMITLTMLNIGRIFYSDFGLFFQVPQSSGALFSVTQTIDTYVYRALISTGGVTKSAAAGFFQSVVGFLFVMGSNLLVRKISPENAMF
ncbi:MAG: sugar ABC transporter permease [Lachnospiraceae bacterium]|nr:sugar ABC transporter permease [Lachnospiraceae bacterium]